MTAPSSTPPTYGIYFAQVLKDLGVPASQQTTDERALTSIVQFEGFNSYLNPLNIEYHPGDPIQTKGIGNFNSVGVQEYGSVTQGETATATFLQEQHWAGVLGALKSGSEQDVVNAIDNAYTWTSSKPPALSNQQANSILVGNILTGKVQPLPGVQSTAGVLGGAIEATVGGAVNAITSVPAFLGKIWADATSSEFWIRVGFIILGFMVLLIAVDKLSDGGISGSSGRSVPQTIDVVTETAGGAAGTASDKVSGAAKKINNAGSRSGHTNHDHLFAHGQGAKHRTPIKAAK